MFFHSMNFSIGKDNEILKEAIFKFAQKEIAPLANQIDKDNLISSKLPDGELKLAMQEFEMSRKLKNKVDE